MEPSIPTATPEAPKVDWKSMYSGLDTLHTRLSEDQRQGFLQIESESDNREEVRARMVNQAYVADKLGIPSEEIDANWDSIRSQYSKNTLGIQNASSDKEVYSAITEHIDNGFDDIPQFKASDGGKPYEVGALDKMRMTVGAFNDKVGLRVKSSWMNAEKRYEDRTKGGPLSFATAFLAGVVQGTPQAQAADVREQEAKLGPEFMAKAGEIKKTFRDPKSVLGGEDVTPWSLPTPGREGKQVNERGFEMFEVLADPKKPEDPASLKTAKAIYGPFARLWNSFTSPVGLMTVGAASGLSGVGTSRFVAPAGEIGMPSEFVAGSGAQALVKGAEKVATGAFAADMAKNAPVSLDTLSQTLEDPEKDRYDVMSDSIQTVADIGLTFLAAKHALKQDISGLHPEQKAKAIATELEMPIEKVAEAAAVEIKEIAKANPETVYQYTVFDMKDKAGNPVIQVDEIKGGVNTRSTNIETLRSEGVELPQPPSEMGRYKVLTDETGAKNVYTEKGDLYDSRPDALRADPKAMEQLTGIKNAAVDAELKAMGLDPAQHGEKITFAGTLAEALKTEKEKPGAGATLVNTLKSDSRPVTALEDALLTIELRKLKNERKAAQEMLDDAKKSGDEAAIGRALETESIAQKLYEEAADVATQVGTKNAQGLAMRRLMIKEDFSLAEMERQERRNRGVERLDAEHKAEVERLNAEIEKARKKYEDYRSRMSELLASDEPVSIGRKGPPKASRVTEYIAERANEARARIKARMSEGRMSSGLDPTREFANLADHAVIGAEYLSKGMDFAAEMVKEFGEGVRPYLTKIYEMAKDAQDTARYELAVNRRIEQLTKQIEEKKAKLSSGDVSPDAKERNRPQIEKIERLALERDALTREIEEARKQILPEEVELLRAEKNRMEERIAELDKKIAKGDFETKQRKELQFDEEANRLQAALEMKEAEWRMRQEQNKFEQLPKMSKAMRNALKLYDVGRIFVSTGELSAMRRQAWGAMNANPFGFAKAIPDMLKAFMANPTEAHAINLKTLNDPLVLNGTTKRAGLHLMREGMSLSANEEMFAGRLLSGMFGKEHAGKATKALDFLDKQTIGRFNQATVVLMNRVRLDLFKKMAKDMPANQHKYIAKFVNQATGRGSLGEFEKSALVLNRLMFSPRFFASRLQLLAGESMWGAEMATKRRIAKFYGKMAVNQALYYGALMTYYGIMSDEPVQLGLDMRSTEFGKVTIGNSRIDPLAGLSQFMVLAARTGLAFSNATNITEDIPELVTRDGKAVRIQGKDVPYGSRRWSEVFTDFLMSKRHPGAGFIMEFLDQKEMYGKADEYSVSDAVIKAITPMTWRDMMDAIDEHDLPVGTMLAIQAFIGDGIQTQLEKEKGWKGK